MEANLRKLDFRMNAMDKLELIAGEAASIFFVLHYKNSPEYFAHSLTLPAKVKIWKTDGTIAEFLGTLLCYYPAAFVIQISADASLTLKIADDMDMEIEVQDVSEVKHIASKKDCLTIKRKLMVAP